MDNVIQQPALGDIIIIDGIPSIEFYTWMEQINDAVNNFPPLVGSGSPEGVLAASSGRWYVDTSAANGEGIYLKQSGDGDTGWFQRS